MHWSYADNAEGDLVQGDILLPTDGLRAALQNVHRWFVDPKYLGFVVISQTCDLVRRQGESCKTPYVEIAVIRPFRAYLLSLLKQQCDWIGDRYFPSGERNRANDLLDRVINQNESTLGLFYLHPEASIGIGEASIALLRVSVALRSEEHYDTLVAARRGRLHPEFGNKLGWICGNLYSRIGIRDWKESEEDRKVATEIKRRLLDQSDDAGPRFVDCSKPFLEGLKRGTINLRDATPEQIEAELERHSSKPYKDRAIEAVMRILESQGVSTELRQRVGSNLKSDREFGDVIRQGKA